MHGEEVLEAEKLLLRRHGYSGFRDGLRREREYAGRGHAGEFAAKQGLRAHGAAAGALHETVVEEPVVVIDNHADQFCQVRAGHGG